jgi:nucleoside-triphosphatase THEP1
MNAKTDEKLETAPFAAAVYTPHTENRQALADFAAELKAQGLRVGGLLQEPAFTESGEKIGNDLVEIDTGYRNPINRPTRQNLEAKECSLDAEKLADSTEALRRAVRENFDLIVLEKFGEQEQKGQGLMDEIFLAISEDIPLLIAVPEPALDLWREQSGDLGDTVAFELGAFRRWWADVRG